MADLSTIGTFVMGGGGLVASAIALYMTATNKKSTEANTGKTQAEEKEIENRRPAPTTASVPARRKKPPTASPSP